VRHVSQLARPSAARTVSCGDPVCPHRTVSGSIYEIQEIKSGRVYVGQTVQKDPLSRYAEHLIASCNAPLRAAMEEYEDPRTAFTFKVASHHEVAPTPTGAIENPELKHFEGTRMKQLEAKGVVLFNIRRDDPNPDLV